LVRIILIRIGNDAPFPTGVGGYAAKRPEYDKEPAFWMATPLEVVRAWLQRHISKRALFQQDGKPDQVRRLRLIWLLFIISWPVSFYTDYQPLRPIYSAGHTIALRIRASSACI
jgi:hypothetical protein